jgi:hypothetical protein
MESKSCEDASGSCICNNSGIPRLDYSLSLGGRDSGTRLDSIREFMRSTFRFPNLMEVEGGGKTTILVGAASEGAAVRYFRWESATFAKNRCFTSHFHPAHCERISDARGTC